MGIGYSISVSTKFEFKIDRSTNKGDLLSDRNHRKHRPTDSQCDTDRQTHVYLLSSHRLIERNTHM